MLDLQESLSFPLLERIDPLLGESILLSHVLVLSMILPPQELFLFLQTLVLPGQAHEVDFNNRVLPGEVNAFPSLALCWRTHLLQSRLEFLNSGLLLHHEVLVLPQLRLQSLLLHQGTTFKSNVVLIKLVLSKQILPDFFIKLRDLLLLRSDGFVLTL